MTADESENMLT